MVESINLAHMPPGLTVFAALYKDVKNASYLREQLLAGNTEFEYAFIDASMILSRIHVLAAAFRAMNDYLHESLKSRNIHSEIVFALSPNNNIGEAFRRFGISDTTSNLLVLKVATAPSVTSEYVQSHLQQNIQGSTVSFDDYSLQCMSDTARIRKVYKLVATPTLKTPKSDGEPCDGDITREVKLNELKEMEVQILGLIALRGAT